jgi:hypothetical protein
MIEIAPKSLAKAERFDLTLTEPNELDLLPDKLLALANAVIGIRHAISLDSS